MGNSDSKNSLNNEKAFSNEKRQCLEKKDKSIKSSIDKPILKLVNLINSSDDYYTTSSCSGRIVLLEKKSDKKQESKWLLICHGKTDIDRLKKALSLSKHDVWFSFEPFILHVCCRDIDSARILLKSLNELGLKRSGIMSLGNRILIEIIGDERLYTLVAKKGKVIAEESYLGILVDEANQKAQRNDQKIRKLEKVIAKVLK